MTPRAFDYLALVKVMLIARRVKARQTRSGIGAYWTTKYCQHEARLLWTAMDADERAAIDTKWRPGEVEGP